LTRGRFGSILNGVIVRRPTARQFNASPNSADARPRFGVRRIYVVALALTVVGAAMYVVIPKVVNSINAQHARAELTAATAAMNGLRVPRDFVRVSSLDGASCPAYRCYSVARSTLAVAPLLPEIVRSLGVRSPLNGVCTFIRAPGRKQVGTCRIDGSTCAVRDPGLYNPDAKCQPTEGQCTILYRGHIPIETCQFFPVIDDNSVSLALQPQLARESPTRWRFTNESQVLIDGP
jgi:hypothetical protein